MKWANIIGLQIISQFSLMLIDLLIHIFNVLLEFGIFASFIIKNKGGWLIDFGKNHYESLTSGENEL